jgi:hypothetical protein
MAQSRSAHDFVGTLSVIWGGAGSERFEITLADGTVYQLLIAPGQHGVALQGFGKRIRVRGRPVPAPGGRSAIKVDRFEIAEPNH